MVRGVEHTAIAARDSAALAAWYCDVLGMRILYKNDAPRPSLLVGGDWGGILEIMPDNGSAAVTHQPFDPGIRHIALRVDDMQEAHRSLQGKVLGLTDPAPAAGGGEIAFFHDPEGNLLQLVSRPPGSQFGP